MAQEALRNGAVDGSVAVATGNLVVPERSLQDLFDSNDPGVGKVARFLADGPRVPLSGPRRGFVRHPEVFDISTIMTSVEQAVPGLHVIVTFSDGDIGRIWDSVSKKDRNVTIFRGQQRGLENADTVLMTNREMTSFLREHYPIARSLFGRVTLLVINGVHFALNGANEASGNKSFLSKVLDNFPNADVLGFTVTGNVGKSERLKRELGREICEIKTEGVKINKVLPAEKLDGDFNPSKHKRKVRRK